MADAPERSPRETPPRRLERAHLLAIAGGVVVAALIAWLALLKTVEEAPRAGVEAARELAEGVVEDIGELARAFREGTITHRFESYATSVEGTTRLQVATLEQVEVFELEDEATAFWGALELPPVRVRVTAPVTTTYYVDFDEAWRFELEGRGVRVTAPPLVANTPALDASEIEYEVREGSLLRDESVVLEQLRRELTGRAARRAQDNAAVVRDTARIQVEGFVRAWFLEAFGDGGEYSVDVRFEGETSDVDAEADARVEAR